MDLNVIQKYLKPSFSKIAIALVIFVLLPSFPVILPQPFEVFPGRATKIIFLPALRIISNWLTTGSLMKIKISVIPFLGIFVSYILSSLIVELRRFLSFLWTREDVLEAMKPTSAPIIISLLGVLSSILLFFSPDMSYFIGPIKSFMGFIHLILFPFAFISRYLLCSTTLIIEFALEYFLGISSLMVGISRVCELNKFGKFFIFPLIILEWYIVSCIAVYLYRELSS